MVSDVFMISGAVLILIILAVPGAYVISRAAAMGWYRSKWEHLRRVTRNFSDGESDGDSD